MLKPGMNKSSSLATLSLYCTDLSVVM